MADGVELAPLRGKVVLDLTEFNEGLEKLEDGVSSLTEKLAESFDVLTEKMNSFKSDLETPIDVNVDVNSDINNADDLQNQIEETEELTEAYDDAKVALANFAEQLGELRPLFNELSEEEQEFWKDWGDTEDSFNTKVLMERIEQLKGVTNEYIDTLHDLTGEWQQCDSQLINLIPLWEQLTDEERQFFESRGENQEQHDLETITSNAQKLRAVLQEVEEQENRLIPAADDVGEAMEDEAQGMEQANIASTALRDSMASAITMREDANAEIVESSNYLDDYIGNSERSSESTKSFGQSAWENALKVYFFGMQAEATGQRLIELGNLQTAGVATAQREYGQYSQSVINWSNQSAQAFGQSKGEALSLANQFALSLKSYGANSQEASKYSEALATMSGQLSIATGGNVDYSEAADAFRSALGGQMYSLESLGISVTKAEENQLALNSAWHKSFSSLNTYQQKVIEIKAIQDALNKTFGSTHSLMQTQYGQWESLTAQLRNEGATIGTILIPPLLRLGAQFIKLTSWINKLSPGTKKLIEDLIEFAVGAGAAVIGIGLFGKALDIGVGQIKFAISATKDLISVFKGVNEVSELTTGLGRAFLTIKNMVVDTFGLLKATFKTTYKAIKLLSKPFVTLGKIVGSLAKKLLWTLGKAFTKIGDLALRLSKKLGITLVQGFKKAIKGAGNLLKSLGNLILKGFNKVIESSGKLAKALADTTVKGFEKVMNGSNKFKTALISLVTNGCEKVISGSSKLKSVLIDLASNGLAKALSATKTLGSAFLDFLPELAGLIVAFGPLIVVIGSVVTAVVLLYEAWQHNWFGIRQVVANALNFIENIISDVLQCIGNIFSTELAFWVDIFTGHFGAAINVVENACSSIKNIVYNLADDMLNAGANMMNSLVQGIEDGAGGVLSAMSNVISSLWSEVWGSGSNSSTHGSHYNGLDFVPFDGYSATLHKGEMVLTAEQAESYRTGGSAMNNNMEIHLHSPEAIDPLEAYNRMEELSRNLANGFY